MITVFYDGKCGLCSKEINHYKCIAPENRFEWVDITQNATEFENLGFSLQEGLIALHVKDNSDQIHIGVDAFCVIWRQLKHWRYLALLIKLPIIYQIAIFSYNKFAQWRFNRLDHCRIAAQ